MAKVASDVRWQAARLLQRTKTTRGLRNEDIASIAGVSEKQVRLMLLAQTSTDMICRTLERLNLMLTLSCEEK